MKSNRNCCSPKMKKDIFMILMLHIDWKRILKDQCQIDHGPIENSDRPLVVLKSLSDETRNFVGDRYQAFSRDQIFPRLILRLFFLNKFFSRPIPRLILRLIIFETNTAIFFETDTETFFRPNFSRPSLRLFKA